MGDSLVVEFVGRKPMPHPLAVARLEVMRPSIAPHINAIEVIVELLEMEEEEPYGEDEMKIVLIGFLAVTEEVDVFSHTLTIAEIFQHDNTILHDGRIT